MSSTRQERTALQYPFQFPIPDPAAAEPYWALMQQSIAHTQPLVQSLFSLQLATMSFAGCRARARLDYASKLTACRTPQAFVEATTEFWQEATRHFTEFGQKSSQVWQQTFAVALTVPQDMAGPIRDLLTLPDPIVAKPDPVRTDAETRRRAA